MELRVNDLFLMILKITNDSHLIPYSTTGIQILYKEDDEVYIYKKYDDDEEWTAYRPANKNTFYLTLTSSLHSRTPEKVWGDIMADIADQIEFTVADIPLLKKITDTQQQNLEIADTAVLIDRQYWWNGNYHVSIVPFEDKFIVIKQASNASFELIWHKIKTNIENNIFNFRSKILSKLWDTIFTASKLHLNTLTITIQKSFDGNCLVIDNKIKIYRIEKDEFAVLNAGNSKKAQSIVSKIVNALRKDKYTLENEKLEPEEEDDEPTREHTIDDDFDVVDNATNTDENNHGGSSVALEVEDGEPREEGNDGAAEQNCPADAVGSQQSNSNSGNTADEPSASSAGEGLDTATDGGNGSNLSAEDKTALPTEVNSSVAQPTDESQQNGTASGKGINIAGNPTEEQSQEVGLGEALPQSLEEDNKRNYNISYQQKSVFEHYKDMEFDEYLLKDIKKVFNKVVSVACNGRKSPELDKKLLFKNLITFRNPYNSFKKNRQNDKVLLLVDTSGSMINFYSLVPYFAMLTAVIKEIIVIENSNMWPNTIIIDGKVEEMTVNYEKNTDYEITEIYNKLIKKYNIKFIVNFTDFDGIEHTINLLEKTKAPMLVMDVYRCAVMDYQPVKDRKYKHLPEALIPYKRQITYYYGVGDWNGIKTVLNEEL